VVPNILEKDITCILLQDLAFILLLEELVIAGHFLQIIIIKDS
jgi:hypothetical protein